MQDELTPAIHQYLSCAATSQFAQQPVEIVAHWEGSENLLWRVTCRGTEAVVKLFLDAGQVRSRRQFDAHTLFSPLGLAPAPLWYDHNPEGLARQVNVYHWVKGAAHTGAQGASLDLAQAVASIHTAAGAVQRFSPHPFNLDFFWRIEQTSMAAVTAWLEQAGLQPVAALYTQLCSAAAQIVDQALPLWASAPATPVHGDLRLEHAIVGPRGICFVDWEMAGLGDPALEIAQFLQRSHTLAGVDALAAWADAYLAAVDLPGLEQRIAAYNALLPLHATTYLLLGLHQNAAPTAEFQEALPFLTDTLAAGLALAAASLGVDLATAPQELAQQVAAALFS
ncbi:MAG: phosphotransferase [Caldilineaceae bacterium]|nr:phosphotransferase [Caldilineaceae bacterium]